MPGQEISSAMSKKRRLLIVIGAIGVPVITGLFVSATIMARRIEPYIREQAMDYLRAGFDSEVELASLSISMPSVSSLRLLLTSGSGARAKVTGEGLIMRHKGRRDLPPLFAIKRFSFDVDLGTVFQSPIIVPYLSLENVEIHIPPKGERPDLTVSANQHFWEVARSTVFIHVVEIREGKLVILPKDPKKKPIEFDLHRVRFESAGFGVAMKYDAELGNSRPPGEIRSQGTLGPWRSDDPGSTPLRGEYSLENADLSVFPAIGGILRSTGNFEGTLDHVSAKGQASVPDFHLKQSGNRLPLDAQFEVVVDGTNGNTVLNHVFAKLGQTHLWIHGGVIKNEGEVRRTVNTDVSMQRGEMRDLLRLAMRGPPPMEGQIALETRVQIPPLDQKIREKLVVDGRFWISGGRFLRPDVQEKIDILSRRGQGQPKNKEIAEVLSHMTGQFHLEDQVIAFRQLTFGVPGADVNLVGNYDLAQDLLDLHGNLKLTAKVSQTMTGWKRWLLKPVDPVMAKKGAGTYIAIKVQGSSKEPKFGRQ
jgi:hypothetical protein